MPWISYKQMSDLLGQKMEIKEKLNLSGYLKEINAIESPPFIVKQTLKKGLAAQ